MDKQSNVKLSINNSVSEESISLAHPVEVNYKHNVTEGLATRTHFENGYNAHDISMLATKSAIEVAQYKEIAESQINQQTIQKYALFREISQCTKGN